MPSYAFLKKNWLGVLGLLVGLAGVALSIVFYTRTLADREPAFFVDPNRTEIIRGDRIATAPLRVTKSDGTEVKGDITSARIYLWNRGKLPIKPNHILSPITLELADDEAEILDYQVVGCSRDVVGPNIQRAGTDPNRQLQVDFTILEQNDGICIQVIYSGNPTASFLLDGKIEGVHEPIGSQRVEESRFWAVYLGKARSFSLVLLAMLLLVGGIFAFVTTADFLKRHLGDERFSSLNRWFEHTKNAINILLVIGFLIWTVLVEPIRDSKKEAKLSLPESVPRSVLRPQPREQSLPNNAIHSDGNSATLHSRR